MALRVKSPRRQLLDVPIICVHFPSVHSVGHFEAHSFKGKTCSAILEFVWRTNATVPRGGSPSR